MIEDLNAEREDIGEQSFESLSRTWDRLKHLESECNQVILDRQNQIQTRDIDITLPQIDVETLHTYLYTALEVTYPVLVDAVDLLDRIQAAREAVFVVISRR